MRTQLNGPKRQVMNQTTAFAVATRQKTSTLVPTQFSSKMARVVSQALIARSTHSSLLPNGTLKSLKHRHTVAEGTLIEIDLETSTETGDSVKIVRIEDLMQTIIAQRSAPSWLPFIPGSSFWVPPKPSAKKVANLLSKCSLGPVLSAEEALSLTTVRGWPSLDHLLRGNEPGDVKLKDSKPADSELQVKVVNLESKYSNNEED